MHPASQNGSVCPKTIQMKPTDIQPNHRIKWLVFDYYAIGSVLILICAIALLLSGILNWKKFAAIMGSIAAFAYGVQKQSLEEIKLFKELFDKFNTKYDAMNDDLNQIHGQPSSLALTPEEKRKLYKYFNLCHG